MPKEDLIELRKQFLVGNNERLQYLYKLYRDDVITVVLAKTNVDPMEIEGHFNEALIVFYENVVSGKVTELSSLKNYLIGTCINLHRREINYKSRLSEKVEEVRLLLYDKNDYVKEDDRNEYLKKICLKGIDKLNDRCQEIIRCYYIDKLTMKEIAQYLNLSSGDVAKTLKSRCFKTLLGHIKSEMK